MHILLKALGRTVSLEIILAKPACSSGFISIVCVAVVSTRRRVITYRRMYAWLCHVSVQNFVVHRFSKRHGLCLPDMHF